MRSRRKLSARLALVVLLSVGVPAHAGETPLLVAGIAFESVSRTVAPITILRFPCENGSGFSLSQFGWTSAARLELVQAAAESFVASIDVTPLRAHFSQDVHGPDGDARPSFDDTSLRLAIGEALNLGHFRFAARAIAIKEWVSGLSTEVEDTFRSPMAGAEARASLEFLRSEEPLGARIDGARIALRAEGLLGGASWLDGDLSVSLGRRWGPVFGRVEAGAFYVSLDTPVTDFVVGGSWDFLASAALFGHPLGAFRLPRGASTTGGLDFRIIGPFELGMRVSMLVGGPTVHDGTALLLLGDVGGFYFFFGTGWPDGQLSKTSLFAGLSSALLFLP